MSPGKTAQEPASGPTSNRKPDDWERWPLDRSDRCVPAGHWARTKDWQQRYAIRAGIEATLSQNIRNCGLRRSRYHGLARTHVQHVLTAMACNLTRIADWIADPKPTRRRSIRFHALCASTA
ncbi:transposase [Streptomyces sp. H27-D2]|uniref:transposase n=1 Tax=Streptomyces sp. H27-D2 TaxID=3046304 RepID=UPI002DBC6BE5|nr:transposase [Streptomyces sp. H27-D2]MEC4019401.1 transposase [Streptomyces sp. H27-D2]